MRRLALEIGVSAATLSQIENGQTGLTVSRLTTIADILGCTVAEILEERGGTGSEGACHPGAAPATAIGSAAAWRIYEPLELDVVLAAAVEEFAERSYHGASMRDISRRCGLSVAGLYHYYASKNAMLETIESRVAVDLTWRLEAARAEGRDSVERFALLVECLVLNHCYHAKMAFVESRSEMVAVERQTRQRLVALGRIPINMLEEEVRCAVAAGVLRSRFPHLGVRAVMNMCSAISQWFRMDGPLTPQMLAEQYVELALRMMDAPA